jgi:molybdate transport system ATP-binding protein
MGRRAMKFSLKNLLLPQGTFLLQADLETSGQVIGIFGNSGAGKTSLLEVVAGLRQPASGFIAVDDRVLMDLSARLFLAPERRGVGYVPQDLALFPHLSVRRNLVYGHKPAALSPGINLAHVAEVLEIESLLDRPISDLSGGQKQRVAFARALLASPRLLLMDEPLASLDQELKLKIIPYLKRIRDEFKIPMLYVSHSPDEVIELCDQVIVMRDGKCLRTSRPGEIFEASTSMALKPGIYDSSK